MQTTFFEEMFKKHQAIMLLIDPANGQIIDSNESASAFYGYSTAQLNSMNLSNINTLTQAEIAQILQSALVDGYKHIIVPHRLASGEIRQVEVHASIITWHNGPVLFAILHDVTERQRAEVALRESEQKLKTIFEVLPVGITVLNNQHQIVYMNPALEKISQMSYEGLLRGDYRQRTFLKVDGTTMPADDLPSRRAIREQRPIYNVETGIIIENKKIIWIKVSAVPVTFFDWGVILVSDDITEQKKEHDKLVKLTQAVEQSNSSIVITDSNEKIEFVNHGFTKITGYTLEEMIGKNYPILHNWYQAAELRQEMQADLKRYGVWQGEIMNKNKSGDIYWELSNISAIKNNRGEVTHYVVVKDDITKRKNLEMELRMVNHQLMQSYDETLEGWVQALDLRDKETEGHSLRVTEMTVQFARLCGVPENELIHIRRGALLHDIGKLGIPDSILLKHGPLDDIEWQIMKLHPIYAYQMLRKINYLRPALDIPYYHHEKWDGTGYPNGSRGAQIPLAARMFALVDVWDALSSDRPYRLAWPKEKIKPHILALAGSHFDPQLVPLFLHLCD